MKGLFPWLGEMFFGPLPERPHECNEFTQWTAVSTKVRIVANEKGRLPDESHYELSRFFQERRCTLCGKIFQQNLTHDSTFDCDDTEG